MNINSAQKIRNIALAVIAVAVIGWGMMSGDGNIDGCYFYESSSLIISSGKMLLLSNDGKLSQEVDIVNKYYKSKGYIIVLKGNLRYTENGARFRPSDQDVSYFIAMRPLEEQYLYFENGNVPIKFIYRNKCK
jgi:hypothetical protein